ncbi:MAG: hypothetical protein VX100_07215 [Pseudomonadota bacterium]|nr:hypothetical protein [Pseudomonadota bacterium]
MSISKEQWAAILEELKGFMPSVKFTLGDDEISIKKVLVKENKTALAVYINGEIKGGWMMEDQATETVKKCWRTRTQALYSSNNIKKIEKLYGKRGAKKLYPELRDKAVYYDPFFNTANSIVSKYKRIEGLSLITIGHTADA